MYEYDFGDSWQHTTTLEKTVNSDTLEVTYLDGRGERPSEDVGGSWGYMEYMRIMADETDPEHETLGSEPSREKAKLRICGYGIRVSEGSELPIWLMRAIDICLTVMSKKPAESGWKYGKW